MFAKRLLFVASIAVLAACGGGSEGGGDSTTTPRPEPVGALAKYVGNYSYCDQDNTRYSLTLTNAGDDSLNALPTEVTYQNDNCTGNVLGTYTWSAPAKLTLTSTGVATVRGDGLPASLTVDKVQLTATNVRIVVSGAAATGNCINYPNGQVCYEQLPSNATTLGALYLSGGKLYEMLLENGVYFVEDVYTKN